MDALRRVHLRVQDFEEDDDPEAQELLRESLLPIRARAQAAGLDACMEAAVRRRRQLLDRRRQEEESRRVAEERRLQRQREQEALIVQMRRQEEELRQRQRASQKRLEFLRKEELFEGLAAQRAANKKKAWEAHPERSFCYVCGLPGVDKPKRCPRRDQHHKFH